LIADNLIEKKTNSNLSNQELVELGTNDLLKKQLVEKVHVSPISMQINDALINLIIGVNFLGKVCPKSCIIFQALPLFILWLQDKELTYLLMCLFIFFILESFIFLVAPK
jgi:hypothetical protein